MRSGISAACMLILSALSAAGCAADSVIDSMEKLSFAPPKEQAHAEIVDGHDGKALKFSFDEGAHVFFTGSLKATPEWDRAEGISFWLKGDGSQHCGAMHFIWNNDYSMRYECAFRLDSTEWRKVYVPWADILPMFSNEKTKPLDPQIGPQPSKLKQLWLGKRDYWRDSAAHSFVIDDLRLETKIERDPADYKPAGAPLERIREKLKAGKPVTIVTMGDSLTDYKHWANQPVNWPTLLKEKLKAKYNSDVTIVNPAIGGTELRVNVVMIPNWLMQAPQPDLVTIFFGANDWGSGMRGEPFLETMTSAVDRVRRATKGSTDVLVFTTCPGLETWEKYMPLVEAARKAAADRHAGLCDIHNAFSGVPVEEHAKLYCRDKVHLGPPGHEVVAKTVMDALEK